jgi:phenylpyruvate tautomerase PptA (4-oxalocrotonate tautomerase family)
MPIVRVDITGPKPLAWKQALLQGVCAAVVEALDVPRERVTVRVVETPDDCVDVPDCRSDRYTFVEVIMYEGRDPEKKRSLVTEIRRRLAKDPGIEASEVAVLIRDSTVADLDVLPPGVGRADD